MKIISVQRQMLQEQKMFSKPFRRLLYVILYVVTSLLAEDFFLPPIFYGNHY